MSVAIAPKKVLIVVKVRNEKFLIASGAEHTTFLSKLEDEKTQKKTEEKEISARKEYDLAQNVKIPKQEIRYDDTQKTHNEKIQEQFMTLMAQKDEPLNRANYKDNKREMLRIVRDKDLNVKVDLTGKMNGRGAYIKKDIKVLEEAIKKKSLEKKLECNISNEVYEEIRKVLEN